VYLSLIRVGVARNGSTQLSLFLLDKLIIALEKLSS
jgi:hypothetical protein